MYGPQEASVGSVSKAGRRGEVKTRNCRTGGVIFMVAVIAGCASTTPETKFMPVESDAVFPFFTAGQPIASVQARDAFILLSLEPTILADEPYFRLWLLYQNTSEKPYLLEPLRSLSLRITSIAKGKEGVSSPESPTKILAHISNEKASSLIMQAIGGSLKAMAVQPTTAQTRFDDGSSATTTSNDQQEKRDMVGERTAMAMTNTAMWYDVYQNSISDGILRRNTVFPGRSINGYIYFPYPRAADIEGRYYEFDEPVLSIGTRYFLTIDLELSGDTLDIYFTPIAGE